MASEASKQVRMWSFRRAPLEFQILFQEGEDEPDWVIHLPQPVRHLVEPLLLRWQPVYPVKSAELSDGSVAYFGAPKKAMDLIAGRPPVIGAIPGGSERRRAVRVQIECQSRYETHAVPKQVGRGRTIDMSSSGISFTTESLLPGGTEVTLHVTWPVHLEDNVLVELRAVGKVTRADATKAAIQTDSMSFSIEDLNS